MSLKHINPASHNWSIAYQQKGGRGTTNHLEYLVKLVKLILVTKNTSSEFQDFFFFLLKYQGLITGAQPLSYIPRPFYFGTASYVEFLRTSPSY